MAGRGDQQVRRQWYHDGSSDSSDENSDVSTSLFRICTCLYWVKELLYKAIQEYHLNGKYMFYRKGKLKKFSKTLNQHWNTNLN